MIETNMPELIPAPHAPQKPHAPPGTLLPLLIIRDLVAVVFRSFIKQLLYQPDSLFFMCHVNQSLSRQPVLLEINSSSLTALPFALPKNEP